MYIIIYIIHTCNLRPNCIYIKNHISASLIKPCLANEAPHPNISHEDLWPWLPEYIWEKPKTPQEKTWFQTQKNAKFMLGCHSSQEYSPPGKFTVLVGDPYKYAFSTTTGRGNNLKFKWMESYIDMQQQIQ